MKFKQDGHNSSVRAARLKENQSKICEGFRIESQGKMMKMEKVVGMLSSRWQPGEDDESERKEGGNDTCELCLIVFTTA